MKKKRSTVFKSAALGIMAIAATLSVGLSACKKTDDDKTDDDETVTKVDTQELKNGNFEFYSDNKGVYPISTPNDWTGSTNGNSSASMSGVIDTRKDRWDYITAESFPDELEANDDKKSDDKTKKDYNGAMPDDLPYKNPHTAVDSSSTEEGAKDYIPNPFTHEYRYDADGKYFDNEGNEVKTYANEKEYGKLYLDESYDTLMETSVLMIHNYRRSYYTGTETSYKSGTTLTLEANTACEISVWVKTDELTFDGAESKRTDVEFERGAYIKVETQVGGNALDSFIIRNINTEKLNPDGANNGWVQYTVFVEASTFAETTVNLTLGLGENSTYTVEGYAFFDDITYTKYLNAGKMAEKNQTYKDKFYGKDLSVSDPVSYPLAPEAETEFRVDKETYWVKSDGENKVEQKTDENYFNERAFLIDCASTTQGDGGFSFDISTNTSTKISAGLTVEDTSTGKFVSAKPETGKNYATNLLGLDNGANADGTHIPTKLGANGLDVSHDILLSTKITKNDWTFNYNDTAYGEKLTEALKTATDLPDAGDETSALVILSAMGAPYEADIANDLFKIADGKYALVSFWIKTEDMKGKTGATITAVEVDENGKETKNSSSFTIDTTTESETNIGDDENVYKGWVRCFIRVSNVSKQDKQFKIKVNFGETTIKGTSNTSYTAGWLALVNPSFLDLDKDVYGYSSGVSHSATLSFTEEAQNTSHNFDSAEDRKLKEDIATPDSYTGINGASIHIKPTESNVAEENEDYNKTNGNAYAGLINKEYFENGNYAGKDWYNALTAIGSDWKTLFDEYTVQPLLIVNTVRTFNEQNKVYNYGYVGKSSSVSADGYTAVSVRVKASSGAIANVYLVEDKPSRAEVLGYSVPEYNFWYDSDGNVLKVEPKVGASSAEKKANIAYNLRKDGLYENGDGKLYANFYNLERYYDVSFEHENFFGEDGNPVVFEKLETGKTYYANAEKTKYAPHYLIAGGNGNSKVYRYNDGVGENATYFYMENNKVNEKKVVYGVDTKVATLRYDERNAAATPYKFTIDTTTEEGAKYADKWVTVTFYIHAGSDTKNYRLELWSGSRDEESSYTLNADNTYGGSYVVFDYSSITLDQTTYEGLRDAYVNEIIADYREKITDELADNDANIAELEKLAESKEIAKSTLFDYEARYYTFSLYDSSAFIPFNGETAEKNQSGYSYDYTDNEEQLTFLKVVDDGKGKAASGESESYTMSAFIDYSALDKDIEIIGIPTAPDDSGNDTDNETNSNSNFWLLFASIALVAVIIVAMVAIFIRDFAKKHKRSKTAGKNSYNFNKNKRYVRKYVKANGEAPTIAEDDVDESLLSDKAEEPAEATTEETAEETAPAKEKTEGAENGETADKANTEAVVETPATEESAAPVSEESTDGKSEEPAESSEAKDEKAEDGEKPDEEK